MTNAIFCITLLAVNKREDAMTRVLLYNIQNEEKLEKLRMIALRLGLAPVAVPREDYAHPLGYLLGREDFAPSETAEDFAEEMLVMEMLSSPLLDALRREGVPVALKAVVTEQNLKWSPAALCRELRREHEAMRAAAPNRHIHQHRKRK